MVTLVQIPVFERTLLLTILREQKLKDLTVISDSLKLTPGSPSDMFQILKRAFRVNAFLKCFVFSFAVDGLNESQLAKIAFQNSLQILVTRGLGLFTGNLLEWRDAVILNLKETQTPDLREIFNHIHSVFEQLRLGDELWSGYRKKILEDQTYILELK